MPTIRIDEEVWRCLQAKATAFEDSPNDVLRRELGIEKAFPECRCGCGKRTGSVKSQFRPGHDVRYYSQHPKEKPRPRGSRSRNFGPASQPQTRVVQDFDPVEIRGESLSATILGERR
jgi:hypothetical protein